MFAPANPRTVTRIKLTRDIYQSRMPPTHNSSDPDNRPTGSGRTSPASCSTISTLCTFSPEVDFIFANKIVDFTEHKFSIPFTRHITDGKTAEMKYSVWVKESMELIEELVTDPTLVDDITWHATKKTLYQRDEEGLRIIESPMEAVTSTNKSLIIFQTKACL
ncbi:hypothetical protein PIIN_10255 [Serendipita indica DSM 11827]|uniref:Uncharacterized protein n=1 Tax=Serendipita indica (strain DSM 11827) TaxID=1109443 RepID=G4TY67_SERID|nr:hypothetical protein PIIN_10255 [Serendipita indica DSM 11827]